jgi:DNA polymerase-3 subunit epsilon
MNWFARLFGGKPELTPEQSARLAAWRELPAAVPRAAMAASRYVVVDVETSGLNLARDRLIAIGAVAVRAGEIQLADSMEIVLRQSRVSSRDNILIHGIGGTAQSEGVPPVEALLAFLEYLGKSPLLAFHAAFDQTMIERALKTFLDLKFNHPWADLAYLCPALQPELASSLRTLDDWMQRFGITNYARHSALADALATAELLIALRPALRTRKIDSFRQLRDLEKAQRMTNWAS